jgi:XTP/dITP diphosphohydrolase
LIQLLCATGNVGKLREFQTINEAVAAGYAPEPGWSTPQRPPLPRIAIELLPDFKSIPPCVEDGATFGENAILKAQYYGVHTRSPIFADDSGLVVDALDGAPGVYSARYSGENATDESNNRLLLEKLRGITDRTARFVCVIALVQRGSVLGLYSGSVEGTILEEPRGTGGFGYDPLFYYPPFGCTFGEASEERKSEVSHRGQALRKMLQAVPRLLGGESATSPGSQRM